MSDKKRIFSGIQPSGNLHIGNYLGAIANWIKLQDEFESIFCVVDMHAITVAQDPETLRKKTLEIAKIYLAAGIDPEKSSIFIQSHVPEHAELMWILNTITKNGELAKMTQFKDKSGFNFDDYISDDFFEFVKKADYFKKLEGLEVRTAINHYIPIVIKDLKEKFNNLSVGLYDYPVLMAADILLYDTEVVPVGEDQKQHVELARDLAKRFNHKFGETFIIPKAFVKEEGMRVMGLDDPSKKMSKSAASEYNYISLTDDAETVRRKIKKAVTDSGSEIVYSDDKPALKNLINIYSSFSGKAPKEIEAMYVGKGYGDFKTDLAEVINNFLTPFQEKLNAISDEDALEILRAGAEKVRPLAKVKLDEVKKKVGFIV
ncbi:MAG: tryptophan--tRNA ligase [Candidatus Moranbacteria bacterium]|nr:tryptophan--tRNA ligase [Candidatus Moranbacteria bacterium]